MRNAGKIIISVFITFVLCLSFSCTKSDSGSGNENTEQILVANFWYIHYYFNNKDETSDFSGYTFTFAPDGTMNATNGSISVGGSWFVTSGNGTEKLVMNFVTNTIIQKLNENWNIISTSNNLIQLQDESSPGHELHFKKK